MQVRPTGRGLQEPFGRLRVSPDMRPFRTRVLPIFALLASAWPLAAQAAVTPARPRDLLAEVPELVASNYFSHAPLYRQDPGGPLVWPPPPPPDPSRVALGALDTAPTNEFSAPPLIVTRISLLPASSGLTPEQIAERVERLQLRDAVTLADRLFREGQPSNAIARLDQLAPGLKAKRNRALLLNRAAAYYFRQQQYGEATALMKQAYEIDPQDVVAACNLAATLLTSQQHDEALRILRNIPTSALSRPQLAFSIHFNMACAYSLRGEVNEGLESLARAAQIDPAGTAASIGDPQLDGLHQDPRFDSLRTSLDAYLKRAQNPRP